MMLVWATLLLFILVVLFRLVPNSRSTTAENRTPLEQLQRRYAAGDLTTSEYDERRRRL